MFARLFAMSLVAMLGVASSARADAALTWDWILGGALPRTPPAVDYLDLDGFDTPEKYVARAKANGTRTICYISAGTLEDWRPDRKAFRRLHRRQRARGKPAILGRRYPEWPGERWLNVKRYRVFLRLMVKRMKLCRSKGFELIEFDNIDAYDNRTGFRIRKKHAIRYARALARRARRVGLVPVHKNTTDLNRKLEPHFGAQLLEDCALYRFCADARRYRKAGKPVFNAEYPEAWEDEGKVFRRRKACRRTDRADVATIIKRLDLDARVRRCP